MSEYDAFDPSGIDISVAHPARMYNYYLGGKTHFAADRDAARVVFIDNDPIVITHSRDLLRDGGLASAVHRDLRDVDGLLADPGIKDALDFGRPIAVLLVAVLHFIRDQEEPARIVRALRDAMPSGSYLVISHGTQDFNPGRATAAVRGYDQAVAPFVLRSREDIEGFFDGLDLVEPGVVQLPFWRPEVIPRATHRRSGSTPASAASNNPRPARPLEPPPPQAPSLPSPPGSAPNISDTPIIVCR